MMGTAGQKVRYGSLPPALDEKIKALGFTRLAGRIKPTWTISSGRLSDIDLQLEKDVEAAAMSLTPEELSVGCQESETVKAQGHGAFYCECDAKWVEVIAVPTLPNGDLHPKGEIDTLVALRVTMTWADTDADPTYAEAFYRLGEFKS